MHVLLYTPVCKQAIIILFLKGLSREFFKKKTHRQTSFYTIKALDEANLNICMVPGPMAEKEIPNMCSA
jgi:hypothetical protein